MDVQEVLERDFPALRVETIDRLGEGWDHVAFLVNGAFVFRLPWHLLEPDARAKVAAPTARAEVSLLRALTGRLPVAAPEPIFVDAKGRYFGYRYLPGRSVEDLRAEDSWSPDPEGAFADLVVDVITAVEDAVAVDEAESIRLRVAGMPRYPEQEGRALASGKLTEDMRSAVTTVLDALPRLWREAMSRPLATLHADLGLDHWLVDRDENPYALIDWSDSCVGPPELQLSTLMWHVPELAASVARRYSSRTGRSIDGELILACGFGEVLSDLGELLGATCPDEQDIAWTLECLRRWSDADLAAELRRVQS